MAKQMYRRISRNEMIFKRLQHSSPREIYGMLLTIAKYRDLKQGWVAHKFKAIFGKWPAPRGTIDPIPPDSDLLSWIMAEGRKYGAKLGRAERRKADQAVEKRTELERDRASDGPVAVEGHGEA